MRDEFLAGNLLIEFYNDFFEIGIGRGGRGPQDEHICCITGTRKSLSFFFTNFQVFS